MQRSLYVKRFAIPLKNGTVRKGAYLYLKDEKGQVGMGEVAPLIGYSRESLEEALLQMKTNEEKIFKRELFDYFPSLSFALESALIPLENFRVPASALLMGSAQEIRSQALLRKKEGFFSAKVKVGTLSFKEAKEILSELKAMFFLRVDVEGRWTKEESLEFFSQFSTEAFDYVEDPFPDSRDLALFRHPLAVDHFLPEESETWPLLKAVIYKPTLRGGFRECQKRFKWCQEKKKQLVLSSSFESDIGLSRIAQMAYSLDGGCPPVGIGTYHHMAPHPYRGILTFSQGEAIIETSAYTGSS